LAAGVAHELGTPLSVVYGHVQRLMRRKSPDSSDYEVLVRVRESAARMSMIVRELLGFGREASPGRKPVPVRRLVTVAVADLRAPSENVGARLEIIGASPEALVGVDETRVREALVHLLRNAVQAAGTGRVRVGWDDGESGVRIFVENSGAPIPVT